MASTDTAAALLLLLLLLPLCYSPPPMVVAAAQKVRLAVYYETFCPYCSKFAVDNLRKIFSDGVAGIVDLELVPYGNAEVGRNGTISCQHGPYECLLNTVEACAISAWPDVNLHFRFVYCVEQLVVQGKYTQWESCFQTLGLNSEPVTSCVSSDYGKQLDLHYAAITDALQPPHTYVPWVVVNGQPLYEDYENFETYICKAYKGNLPQACVDLLLMMKTTNQTDRVGRVCHHNKRVIPSLVRLSE